MTDARPWATARFGLGLRGTQGSTALTELVSLGLRRNPRRAHLLVSQVLGKHIAAPPATVIGAGRRLGAAVTHLGLGEADVLGMAETATGLGHCVADGIDAALYLHTTRRTPTAPVYATFQEGHSHATDHSVQPSHPGLFSRTNPLVLVDDEISTGKTALAAINALHRVQPRPRYVVASLVDVREEAHLASVAVAEQHLDTRIDFVSLSQGTVELPNGLVDAVCSLAPPQLHTAAHPGGAGVPKVSLPWPPTVPEGARHGFLRADRAAFDHAVDGAAAELGNRLDASRPVLVVGHEELMYLPLRIADTLAHNGFQTRFQSTTRSPAYVVDDPGYPLRQGWTFPACEFDEPTPRYLYNGWQPGAHRVQLLLVVDQYAGSGNLTLGATLAGSGYDVLVAEVRGPDMAALHQQRTAGQP